MKSEEAKSCSIEELLNMGVSEVDLRKLLDAEIAKAKKKKDKREIHIVDTRARAVEAFAEYVNTLNDKTVIFADDVEKIIDSLAEVEQDLFTKNPFVEESDLALAKMILKWLF